MNKSKQNKAKIFWFKKWSKKNYSIFASIGKQICISVLAFSYSLISLQGYSQKDKSTKTIIDSDTLPEVEINADENDILDLLNIEIQTITNLEGFSSASKTELPKLLPALEIRQRGSYGVQGDLQFRGGSPEQCLVLLNNIPINNAQTGHHNLNIPVPDIAINKVSIFSVGENIANIAGAYSGLLKYSTIKPKGNNIGLNLFSGSHKFLKAEILSNFEIKKLKNLISVAREQSSGYKANTDFKTTKLYYNSNLKIKKQKLEFEIGASKKEFGAQGFYSNAFPIQFEKIITSFSAINYQNYGKTPFQASIYWKRTYDRFELFRESFYAFENGFYIWDKDTARYSQSSFYEGHNYHLSDNLGASTLITKPIKHGKLITGFNYNFEHIFSNVLGNNLTVFKNNIFENSILFNKSAERHTSYGFISFDSKKHKKLKLNAQINALFYNIFPLINGGISLHYLPKNNLRLWLSANSSSRLPSFTELYYSTATNIGNASLKAETANNYELGKQFHYKNLEIQNRIFVIWGKNTIDWVRKPDETIYYAMNHTQIVSYGNSISINFIPSKNNFSNRFLNFLSLNYTYLHKDKYSKGLISAYNLNYLRHNFNLMLDCTIYKNFSYNFSYQYFNRNGTYTVDNQEVNYKAYNNFDFAIYYKTEAISLSFAIYNVFGAEQIDFGGIILPKTTFNFGFKLYPINFS